MLFDFFLEQKLKRMKFVIDIKRALYAGILVGIGDIAYITIENNYIGAMLFSLALLTVINSGLNLYTGKIGFYKKYNFRFLIKILLANLIGVAFVYMIFLQAKEKMFLPSLTTACNKFSCGSFSLFILGLLCGMCMHIAVSNKNKIITIFSIMIFILCGFRHCIADFPFLVLNFSLFNPLKFIVIILGNSIGAMIINFLSCE